MSSKSQKCPGCFRTFARGYLNHLAQTSNPECVKVRDRLDSYIPQMLELDDLSSAPVDAPHGLSGSDHNVTPNITVGIDGPTAEVASCSGGPDSVDIHMNEASECVYEPEEDDGDDGGPNVDVDADVDVDEELADEVEQEHGWEPPVSAAGDLSLVGEFSDEHDSDRAPSPSQANTAPAAREHAQRPLRQEPYITPFPTPSAAQPIDTQGHAYDAYTTSIKGCNGQADNVWAPFASQTDYETARWAKLRGPGSTAFTDLLKVPGVCDRLGLSYQNSQELNKIIDTQIPHRRPRFKQDEIVIAGEAYDVYYRDIIECVRALYGDPDLAQYLVFQPERHYTDADKTSRLYHDMHTGKWWWETQILLGYLPTARLDHVTNDAARRRCVANLFHAAMELITKPLVKAGLEGLVMASGDGVRRRCHPLLACYVGDYPEQVLVTATKYGECPKCEVSSNDLGDADPNAPYRDLKEVLDALSLFDGDPREYAQACRDAKIKPIYHPFWRDLPYCDIFQSVTPDVLHQLYQGMVKHLISWLKSAFGEAEINARCRRLPPNHNIRLFLKGLSCLQRVSGAEHAQICRILLGLIIGLRLPDNLSPVRLLRAVRGLLDFLYLAQYPSHSEETLDLLRNALDDFHQNKDIFVDLGIRDTFNLPKLHSFLHYLRMIRLFGTTDNYSTEYTERLHIDLAKDAYRATNHKDEYAQMTRWLERREKIMYHDRFIRWRLSGGTTTVHSLRPRLPSLQYVRQFKIAKHPSARRVFFTTLASAYGAQHFHAALARYIVLMNNAGSSITRTALENKAASLVLNTSSVNVFHKIRFIDIDSDGNPSPVTADAIHARPQRQDARHTDIPCRFDTALITRERDSGTERATGVAGYCVARVHVIFSINDTARSRMFSPATNAGVPKHLAYVSWYTAFGETPDRHHGLYPVRPEVRNGEHLVSIIPVSSIARSVHLFPKFGPVAPRDWSSSNVLDLCPSFFVNPFTDRHAYMSLF
ncbi:hypothetical protein CONPUDRAFT_93688 [Coniophora puteana RWD-64-598 SS2]|uniref:Uncharacterized protein n=1 Tax=Coniophora puteana (strain RWD-64-598) TaxID=741705 RepID=A0A5M3M798_CONPW|nr:uncharacterized protein CONPUDRAFT_93688 [Coniophora puteana RWD-64-598 SS2]EIW74923.1 hypothetical protein CONPUDRAFT_93688 [Coniophora puteana RWD-64-598 SS2]